MTIDRAFRTSAAISSTTPPQHRAPLAPVMVATRLFGRFYRDEQLRTCPQREAVHPGKGAPEG